MNMPTAPILPMAAAPAVTTSEVAGSSAPVSVGAEGAVVTVLTAVLTVVVTATVVVPAAAEEEVSSAGVVSAGVVSAGVVSAAEDSSPPPWFSQRRSEAGRTSSVDMLEDGCLGVSHENILRATSEPHSSMIHPAAAPRMALKLAHTQV